jgi:hypothetical protein
VESIGTCFYLQTTHINMVIQNFQNVINNAADAGALGLCTRQFTKARIVVYRRFES